MTANVVLVASTIVYRNALIATPYDEHPFPGPETVMSADELAEFAGRTVYGSWDREQTNAGFLQWLTAYHPTAFEHASATFWISGVSSSLAHDLVMMHRGLSVSQFSQQRDQSGSFPVFPPAIARDKEMCKDAFDLYADAIELYKDLVETLMENGTSFGDARTAARAVLPNCTETTLLVTANMRTWREFIGRAFSVDPGPEMLVVVLAILNDVKRIAPNSFLSLTENRPIDDEPASATSEFADALQSSATLRAA